MNDIFSNRFYGKVLKDWKNASQRWNKKVSLGFNDKEKKLFNNWIKELRIKLKCFQRIQWKASIDD